MQYRIVTTIVAGYLAWTTAVAQPVVPDGYTVELYASGIGAANALAIGPDGLAPGRRRGPRLAFTETGAVT